MRPGALFSLVLAGACIVPAATAQTGRSPFLPPNTAGTPTEVTENAPLQFCGYMGAGDNARYCLFDPASRRSIWLPVGGESTGMRLESFDPEARTVQVVHGGRTLTLKLQSPTPAGGGNTAATPAGPLPVAGQAQPNSALVNSVVTNPTPADEAKRLEAVAAEVRRRRALRQAAAQQQQQQQQQQRGNGR